MVLHDGDADLVALVQDGGAEGLSDEVERLAGVASEDDLRWVIGAHEGRDLGAGLVNGRRRVDGELVEAAERVGVHRLVEAALRVEHGRRTLRSGGAVEERELGVVREQGEVRLEGARLDVGHVCHG